MGPGVWQEQCQGQGDRGRIFFYDLVDRQLCKFCKELMQFILQFSTGLRGDVHEVENGGLMLPLFTY